MGLVDYLDEPDETQFVAECDWCGRPVREGEHVLRADAGPGWRRPACLDCDAVLDGDLARTEGET